MTTFALCSETRQVTQSDLFWLAQALEQNLAHCAEAYLKTMPAVVVIGDVGPGLRNLPPKCFPIVFEEADAAKPTTLGEHWFNYDRDIPVSRVIVNNTSGLNNGRHSASETASHEAVEALCNPMLAVWMKHPTRRGVQVAYENADPTQTHYEVEIRGTPWKVANFVTPQWFMRGPFATGTKFDYLGTLSGPGMIGSEGYAVMRQPNGRGGYTTWSEDFFGQFDSRRLSDARKRALKHPMSRSRKLGLRP